MTWLVQPSLVNEPFSDPGLFIDFRFGRRAVLFDLGDLTPLSPRQLLRVTHCFVSHTHMDHFAGFDRLLRICLHRETPLHLIGPEGFADRVEHKLWAYTLNLLDEDSVDFTIIASEFGGVGFDRVCEFRAREAFRRREQTTVRLAPGLLLDEEEFWVEGAVLDHGIPCLAFALEEKLRVNVWREGLRRLGLPVGPWLREAKAAVRLGAPDHTEIGVSDGLTISLGDLRQHALREPHSSMQILTSPLRDGISRRARLGRLPSKQASGASFHFTFRLATAIAPTNSCAKRKRHSWRGSLCSQWNTERDECQRWRYKRYF